MTIVSEAADRRSVRRAWRWLLLICAAALAIRLLWLNADPDPRLTWSGAPFTDEGLYSHAARNRVLFGTWRTDGWDDRLVSPVWDALAAIVFRALGVGYVQLRLINVALTTAALALWWSVLRADLGDRWALLGTALWATDYFWFQYSRLGLLEPGVTVCLVGAAWCWRSAVAARRPAVWRWSIACGGVLALAYVWKSLALIAVPVPLLALLLIRPLRWRIAGGLALGLALGLIVYAVAWYLPNRAAIAAYTRFYAADRVPTDPAAAFRVLWNNLRARELWGQTPVLLIAAIVGALLAIRPALRRALPPSIALCLAWLICGAGMLLMPYSPSRYYTLLVPPIVGLACYALARADQRASRPLALALLGAALAWSGFWYARWAADRRTTLIDTSRRIGQRVPPGELVLGVHACGLSLENRLPCAPPFAGLANDDRPVERLGAGAAVVEAGSPDDFMRRFYPDLLRRSTAIERFVVGPRTVVLYDLADR